MIHSNNLKKYLGEKVSYWTASNPFKSRLLLNSFLVGVGIITTHFCGFITQIILAFYFGTSRVIDVYILALSFVLFFQNLLSGAFHTATIPIYIHSKKKGVNGEDVIVKNQLFSITLMGGILFSIIILSLVPFIIRYVPNFDTEDQQLLYKLTSFLLPFLTISILSALARVLLQADNQYSKPTIAMICGSIFSLGIIVSLLNALNIYALVIGMLMGAAIEMIILGRFMCFSGYNFKFDLTNNPALLKTIFVAYLPVASGSLISALTPIAGKLMSANIGSGNIASLAYGQRAASIVLGIIIIVLSQTLMPEFAKLVADGNIARLLSVLKKILKILLYTTIPAVVFLIVFSEDITQIIFERGQFTSSDTKVVSAVQVFYFSQIPAYIIGIVLTQVLIALRATNYFLWMGILNFLIFFTASYFFIDLFGVAGISLSESLTSWIGVIITFFYINIHISRKYNMKFFSKFTTKNED